MLEKYLLEVSIRHNFQSCAVCENSSDTFLPSFLVGSGLLFLQSHLFELDMYICKNKEFLRELSENSLSQRPC